MIKAGKNFGKFFIEKIKDLSRDIRIENLTSEQKICPLFSNEKCYRIATDYNGYNCLIDFKEENLKILESIEEVQAVIRAISNLAFEYIKSNYPKDDSGTSYSLTVVEAYRSYSICPDMSFTYTAKNGNYVPPQEL